MIRTIDVRFSIEDAPAPLPRVEAGRAALVAAREFDRARESYAGAVQRLGAIQAGDPAEPPEGRPRGSGRLERAEARFGRATDRLKAAEWSLIAAMRGLGEGEPVGLRMGGRLYAMAGPADDLPDDRLRVVVVDLASVVTLDRPGRLGKIARCKMRSNRPRPILRNRAHRLS